MFYSHLHTKMDPPYNVHFTYNYVQCKPNAPIYPYSADRGSGVVFSIASGFLRQKTDLVKTKEVAVTSVLIYILWFHTLTWDESYSPSFLSGSSWSSFFLGLILLYFLSLFCFLSIPICLWGCNRSERERKGARMRHN